MRAALPIVVAALSWIAHPAPAAAQDWTRLRAAGSLEMDLSLMRRDDPAAAAGLEDTAMAGIGLRAWGGKTAGLMLGLDLRLGAGRGGGFAYDADLMPLGAGVALGPWARFGLLGGIDLSGVTGHVPFAVGFPLEARLELDLGYHVHLAGWAGVRAIAGADARQNGSANAPFGDELRLGATVRGGRGAKRWAEVWGNGVYLGILYAERLGTRELGAVIGWGITDQYVGNH